MPPHKFILIGARQFFFWFHKTYPHIDLNHGMALFQRIKNSIVYPDKEVIIEDLNISVDDAQKIIGDFMSAYNDFPGLKYYWKGNLNGREFDLTIKNYAPEFLTMDKKTIEKLARERNINYDKPAILPKFKPEPDQDPF